MGVAVHDAISTEIGYWAEGETTSATRAVRRADELLLKTWANRLNEIVECGNGLEEPESLITQFRNVSRNRLDRFFRMMWPQFSRHRHLMHEEEAGFAMLDHRIRLRIDLACWDDRERLIIVDWKTGRRLDDQTNRDQLAVYALWANLSLGIPADSIEPTLVSVVSGDILRFAPTDADLEAARALITADFDRVDAFSQAGEFPPWPSPEKCWACPHLRGCAEGSAAVGASWE